MSPRLCFGFYFGHYWQEMVAVRTQVSWKCCNYLLITFEFRFAEAFVDVWLLTVAIRGLDLVLTFGVWGGSPLPFPGYHTPRLKQRLI